MCVLCLRMCACLSIYVEVRGHLWVAVLAFPYLETKPLLFMLGTAGCLVQMLLDAVSTSVQSHLGSTKVTDLCYHAHVYISRFKPRSQKLSRHTLDLLNHFSG